MKYAAVYKDTLEIIYKFKEKAEAYYYITDVFGPEWYLVTILELPDEKA